MDLYSLPALQRQYFSRSEYSPSAPRYPPADSLLQWPANRYFDPPYKENLLLAEAINVLTPEGTLAEQVFSQQLHRGKLTLKVLANLLNERVRMHIRHLREIGHRDMDCQEALFGAKLQAALDGGRRQGNIEKIIIQLEQNKRQEELIFWKDTAELREKLFEAAAGHSDTRHRASLLAGLEDQDG